jgi:hypothetical protein
MTDEDIFLEIRMEINQIMNHRHWDQLTAEMSVLEKYPLDTAQLYLDEAAWGEQMAQATGGVSGLS